MINFFSDVIWKNGEDIPYNSDPLSFMYSIFIITGVLLVIFVSAFKLHLRAIPLKDFLNGIYISLPIGILGASIFGKLGASGDQWKIYMLFFFWEPGMSFFGSMLCGGTAAFLWLWHKSRYTKISIFVYADCIVPNILLGQSIGRWGNLFNHEILGREISDANMSKITWLPNFIWHRLFYFHNLDTGETFEKLQFHEPLFLYESFATLLLWILITFVIANLWKIINKKPWKKDPLNFPNLSNSIYQSEIPSYSTQVPIRYLKDKNGKVYLSRNWAWKKAYTLYEPQKALVNIEQRKIDESKIKLLQSREKYRNLTRKINQDIQKKKDNLIKGKISKNEFKIYKKDLFKNYRRELKRLKIEKNYFNSWVRRDSKNLYKLNNPYDYRIVNSGVLAGVYISGYTILRFILDPFRNPYELTVKENEILNYLFLTMFLTFGIAVIIFAQFIAPKKWREEGWLYEKSY
ncbi:prolipoprotein diacylglyceryl transferase [Spiroplasma diminutum]|uniref:Prolipoprotein diacylglyceryl transferase n=1 Tax=Spiroplasma diminutum CUAS-1 TaxID=1276221 RepID=S5MDH7_9MOLU|nr:prolipoprotein diacylglyceryl transferase family protein [Spiroplasma diminutum]AGR41773.1 prolipoprotein diacylglyceryl transferase [Spiroplasma diminutum CUAS-1]